MRITKLVVTLLALSACSKTPTVAEGAPTGGDSPIIVADGRGFNPSQITLKKGSVGKLRFERRSDETCATEVLFPDLNIKQPLPLNQIVEISVPTSESKTYAFTCGMGMFKSSVVVQ
jgi:plastocyanin domain-containing protein